MKDKMDQALEKNKKILLFSHHPLFTYGENVGLSPDHQFTPLNVSMYEQFADYVKDITAWYWGHEHTLYLFKAYMGLKRGRLVGHGSCPLQDRPLHQLYQPYPKLVTTTYPLPEIEEGNWKLRDNGQEMNNGFVLLHLEGSHGMAEYYEIPSLTVGQYGAPECTFTEHF